MSAVDLWGKPITGNTHSEFYNKHFGNQTNLTAKQKYELEKKKLKQAQADQAYQVKLQKIKEEQLKMKVANARNAITKPQVFEQTKRKIDILKGFFK
jgi:cell fate regulator YaaT (PSP1 superfamily)